MWAASPKKISAFSRCARALILGYSFLSHCPTRASSRSCARCKGFWQVMPICASSRPNRIGTQHDTKLVLDQLCHHIARPQRERELQLQRILPRYGVVNPLHGARIQFGRSAEKRLGLQRSPSTSPILGQPSVYRTADDPQGSRDNFGAFAGLYAPHGADAHRFQRRVIQLAGIILSHSTSESDQIRNVKKKVEITYGLTNSGLPARDRMGENAP